jgi:hypothetical protein
MVAGNGSGNRIRVLQQYCGGRNLAAHHLQELAL